MYLYAYIYCIRKNQKNSGILENKNNKCLFIDAMTTHPYNF